MARALIPNSTPIPDVILDHWMAELSGAEFKVLLYVARRTYGFGKESDNISLNQMASGIKRRDGTNLDHGTGLSRSGVKTACNGLIERGLLIRVNNMSEQGRECEESTYRLNLYAERIGVGQKKAYLGQKKAQVGQIMAKGGTGTDQGVGQKLTPQDTDQETEQETAACELRPGGPLTEAAAALLKELLGHGVSKAVAQKLVLEKPDVCRRCLEYLPHAEVRTSPGAWLANAIRDEYGPPSGFEKAKAQAKEEQKTKARSVLQNALKSHERAIREEKEAKLRETLRLMEKTHSDDIRAFNEHVEEERAKASRIILSLSPKRREEYLATFDEPESRLKLFGAWLEKLTLVPSMSGSSGPSSANQ